LTSSTNFGHCGVSRVYYCFVLVEGKDEE